ncbi:MAG: NAD(P)-dependent oxidoreductase [Parcubacteria group bacterium]|nr:NAD(P)-dependent oxidoreductase [Parcubacteria group bacterium]
MKYLVTGGAGKLGTELCPLIDCTAPAHCELDILSPEQIEKFASRKDIDAIIHLAAISSKKAAEENKPLSYSINVIGTRNIAQAAAKFNKKIVYISTESVFDGSRGDYKEDEPANPHDWYALTKYAGELEIQNSGAEHLIIRTTFRPSKWGFPTTYTNFWTTGDYVDVIAKEVALAISYGLTGIIHIGTPKKTWYELAKQRNPEIKPEEYPDSNYLRVDLNLEKWEKIKKEHGHKT